MELLRFAAVTTGDTRGERVSTASDWNARSDLRLGPASAPGVHPGAVDYGNTLGIAQEAPLVEEAFHVGR
jgi:hypothetical protein